VLLRFIEFGRAPIFTHVDSHFGIGIVGGPMFSSRAGPGVPEGKLEKIFETFYTTKKHGTGLGLAIARTIIEAAGGKVWAENQPGIGAVFRFTVPLATTI